jgi:hypothetical protein
MPSADDYLHSKQKRPRTVEQMWTQWLSAKLEEQERAAAASRGPPLPPPSSGAAAAGGGGAVAPGTVRGSNSSGSGGSLIASGGGTPTPAVPREAAGSGVGALVTLDTTPISTAAVEAAEAIASAVTAIANSVMHPTAAGPTGSAGSNSAADGTKPAAPMKPAGAPEGTDPAAAEEGLDDADWILKAVSSADFKDSEWEDPDLDLPSHGGSTHSAHSAHGLQSAHSSTHSMHSAHSKQSTRSAAAGPALTMNGTAEGEGEALGPAVVSKRAAGVTTQVRGRSGILTAAQIQQLEEVRGFVRVRTTLSFDSPVLPTGLTYHLPVLRLGPGLQVRAG